MALTCGTDGSTGTEVVTQINENTDNIETIMAGQNFRFWKDEQTDHLDVPETYEEIGNLAVTDLPAGQYVLFLSMTYQLDLTNKSVYFRFALNEQASEEFSAEPKDSTDREAKSYGFPYTHTGGDFSLVMDLRKEDANGVLNCYFSNIWLERKDY